MNAYCPHSINDFLASLALLFVLVPGASFAKTDAQATHTESNKLLAQSDTIAKSIRSTSSCLQRHSHQLQTGCVSLSHRGKQKRCLLQVRRLAWQRCKRHLQSTRKRLQQYKAHPRHSYVQHARYRLKLSLLCVDYHLIQAGPPLLPPMTNFFVRTHAQHRTLLAYTRRYQSHLGHLYAGMLCLKRYHQWKLQLHKRSGIRASIAFWQTQASIFRLRFRYVQGRFHLAFLRRSLTAYQHHAKQREWNKQTDTHLRETQKQLKSLQTSLQSTKQHIKRIKRMTNLQQQKVKQLHKRSLAPMKQPAIRYWYAQLQEEVRQEPIQPVQVTAFDLPHQIQRWQRCDITAQRKLRQQRQQTTALLWTGLGTTVAGTAGAGVGLYFVIDSQNKTRYRPADAANRQSLGTAILLGSGIAAFVGVALIVASQWAKPSPKAALRQTLSCPPKKLFRTEETSIPVPPTTGVKLLTQRGW